MHSKYAKSARWNSMEHQCSVGVKVDRITDTDGINGKNVYLDREVESIDEATDDGFKYRVVIFAAARFTVENIMLDALILLQ